MQLLNPKLKCYDASLGKTVALLKFRASELETKDKGLTVAMANHLSTFPRKAGAQEQG